MNAYLVLAIIWYIFLLVIIADEGSRRKLGAWNALGLSIIYTPLFGILFVIASERKQTNQKIV